MLWRSRCSASWVAPCRARARPSRCKAEAWSGEAARIAARVRGRLHLALLQIAPTPDKAAATSEGDPIMRGAWSGPARAARRGYLQLPLLISASLLRK